MTLNTELICLGIFVLATLVLVLRAEGIGI
jgi:hypothetical protein